MVMSGQKREQRQRYLQATGAIALYSEYCSVPKEAEIDSVPSNQSLIQSSAWHTLFTEATKAYWTTGTVLTNHEQPTTITTGQGICQCMRGAYSTHTTPLGTILER